ncbi:MAG: beta-lactamase family protein [Deltaproteobacteria bacterium]|nr:beta-lactamase family protein [Deltaproteobacteria bacterium]
MKLAALSCLLLAACAPSRSPAPAPPAPTPAAGGRTLAADEAIRAPSGATFPAPAGWWVDARGDLIELRSPEGDLHWFHVELAAADRDAAVAAAWKRAVPDFALAVEEAQDVPLEGWDAAAQVKFATPALSRRVVIALARKKGELWHVDLVDGGEAALDRRGAQVETGLLGLAVAGVEEESLAGREVALPADFADQLDAFVREGMAAAKVPGVAIAVVHRDKVVLERGWGVRTLGDKAPVTPATRFMIGSTTKPLTSLLMARLVDAGKLAWDTPVAKLMPTLAFGDPDFTKALTLRHTVCACTGMPRRDHDLIFDGEASPEQRIAALRDARPTTKIGETFQYSNVMVMLGGYAAARAVDATGKLGPAYARAMREQVFGPLGMTATTFDLAEAARAEHASPHPRDLAGEAVAQPPSVEAWTAGVAPAGSAWSTVRDMARVVRLELGEGKLDGAQVVSREALLARRAPQVKISNKLSYGMALVVGTALGLDVVWHNGGTFGFSSLLTAFPQQQLGIVILTNAGEADALAQSIQRRILELVLGAKPKASQHLADAVAAAAKERAQLAARASEPDPAWAAPLLGKWSAPGVGVVELRRDGKRLVLDTGQWSVTVAGGTRDGARELVSTSAPVAGFELVVRGEGANTTLIGVASGQDEIELRRVK